MVIAGRYAGGPAKVSIFSSAFMGVGIVLMSPIVLMQFQRSKAAKVARSEPAVRLYLSCDGNPDWHGQAR
jgi:hypothetical protein